MNKQKKCELRDCSGCTDLRNDPLGGTHAMHTKQHPCPEGGDPNCGYCFPKEDIPSSLTEEQGREWEKEFREKFREILNLREEKEVVKFITTLLHDERERAQDETIYSMDLEAQSHWYEKGRAEERERLMMKYLLAFGSYVPLGGGDAEPEVMAKKVIEVWGEVARAEERERVVEMIDEELAIQMKVKEKAREIVVVGKKKVYGMVRETGKIDGKIEALSDLRAELLAENK